MLLFYIYHDQINQIAEMQQDIACIFQCIKFGLKLQERVYRAFHILHEMSGK